MYDTPRPEPRVIVRPEKGTDNWQFLLSKWHYPDEGHFYEKPVDGIEDFEDGELIWGVVVTGFGKEKDDESDKWQTASLDFVRNKFLPFLKKHLDHEPSLDVTADYSKEINLLFKIWREAMGTYTFHEIEMNYCGIEAETYLTLLAKNGKLRRLDLNGIWPLGAKNVVMTYIASTQDPILTLNKKNRLDIDKELFDLMIDKFIKGNFNYIRNMCGELKVDPGYMKSVYAERLITPGEQGNGTYTWKSPAICRSNFEIRHKRKCCLKVGVEVSIYSEGYLC